MSTTALYIIILNYNSSTDTICLYQELLEQGFVASQIIIVDNASKPEDQLHLKKYIPQKQLRLLNNNKGYAAGNHVGIEEAIAANIPYVLLLNPDIRLASSCITRLLEQLKKENNVAAIGPRICYRNDPDRIYSDGGLIFMEQGCHTTHLHYNTPVYQVPHQEHIREVDYVNGSVFMVKTAAFLDIGFMRSDFFLYFEETEWCVRAKQKGYKLASLSTAVAYHSSSHKGILYHYYMMRNRLLLSRLYPAYYVKTKQVLWGQLKKDLKKTIKVKRLPSRILRAKLKGFIVGNLKRIANE